MEKTLLAAKLTNNLFANRDSIDEALDYVEVMLNATGNPADRAAYTTAVGVLCNTIANILRAMPNPADSPAAGVTGFEDALIKLIDARIANNQSVSETYARIDARLDYWMEDQLDSRIKTWVDENMSDWMGDHAEAIDLESQIQHYIDNSVDFTEIVREEIRQNISFSVEVD